VAKVQPIREEHLGHVICEERTALKDFLRVHHKFSPRDQANARGNDKPLLISVVISSSVVVHSWSPK